MIAHSITTIKAFIPIYHLLDELPVMSVVLFRRPRVGNPGWAEDVAAMMAVNHGFPVEWFEPEPGGREQTYIRDFELVQSADRVVAYFDSENVMGGGTAHVVEAAMMRDIPVEAWSIDDKGHIERVGEVD